MKTEVVVVNGAGGISIAIARQQVFGRLILLADFNEKVLESAELPAKASLDLRDRESPKNSALRLCRTVNGSR